MEIRDVKHLWGKNIPQVDAMIKEELNDQDMHIAIIGPAGENMVRYANIMSDVYRAAGRCGMGAVMGSKNLKAVAVRGTNPVEIARPQEFFKMCAQAREKMKQDLMAQMLYDQGTLLLTMPANNEQGWLCWRNFQKGYHPDARLISGENHRDNFLAHREGCFGCSISCGRFSKIPKGKYAGEITGGPEFETLAGIGPRIGLLDLASIVHNNKLVNELGMDSCSCGAAMKELLKIGGRIIHLERAYWNSILVGRLEDKNPPRFQRNLCTMGPTKGPYFLRMSLFLSITRYLDGRMKRGFPRLRY